MLDIPLHMTTLIQGTKLQKQSGRTNHARLRTFFKGSSLAAAAFAIISRDSDDKHVSSINENDILSRTRPTAEKSNDTYL